MLVVLCDLQIVEETVLHVLEISGVSLAACGIVELTRRPLVRLPEVEGVASRLCPTGQSAADVSRSRQVLDGVVEQARL